MSVIYYCSEFFINITSDKIFIRIMHICFVFLCFHTHKIEMIYIESFSIVVNGVKRFKTISRPFERNRYNTFKKKLLLLYNKRHIIYDVSLKVMNEFYKFEKNMQIFQTYQAPEGQYVGGLFKCKIMKFRTRSDELLVI